MSIAPIFSDILSMIGNTPMYHVQNMDTGLCRLYLKLENQNPTGSIKDRIGLSMISQAEEQGLIKPGDTLIEATAGNTGLGLALVAIRKGYQLIIVVPDKMSQEKIYHLKAMGAQVFVTRSDVGKGHPEYYQDMAETLAEKNNWFYINQFGNQANPQAHIETTGPEILAQIKSEGYTLDAMVCGVGSGGTVTGLSHYFSQASPQTKLVLADPEGSILAHYIKTGKQDIEAGSWMVEGIGEDFLPDIADFSKIDKAYTISDEQAFTTARELLLKEGIFGGSSTGTLLSATLQWCREQTKPQTVVTIVPDSGAKYLSKMYNDYWMLDNGFIELERKGDLSDLIARKHGENSLVTVKPETNLEAAYKQMKLYDISQLPVMQEDGLAGIVDEEDLLLRVYKQGNFDGTVTEIMTRDLHTVNPTDSLEKIMDLLTNGMVVPVVDGNKFLGLITKIDLLNHLRLYRN